MTVEGILHALSDPARAAIYAEIAESGCADACSNFASVTGKDIPKSTLSLHFRILREAGLVRSERIGTQMRNTARCPEVNQRFPGLLGAILSAHKSQAALQKKKRRKATA